MRDKDRDKKMSEDYSVENKLLFFYLCNSWMILPNNKEQKQYVIVFMFDHLIIDLPNNSCNNR